MSSPFIVVAPRYLRLARIAMARLRGHLTAAEYGVLYDHEILLLRAEDRR